LEPGKNYSSWVLENGGVNMRFNKKPKIYVSQHYVGAKDKEKAKRKPVEIYWDLRKALDEISLAQIQEASHNPTHMDLHETCNLKDHLEKRVQHLDPCPEHTFTYLLPNNVSVRINPTLLSVKEEPKIELIKGRAETRVHHSYRDELFIDVLVRRTTRKEPKYLKHMFKEIGRIE